MKKPSKVQTGGAFKTLVAGISSPSDPSQGINSTVDRRAVTQQQVSTGGGSHTNALMTGTPTGVSGTIQVNNNDFATGVLAPGASEIHIGDHVLIADHHFDANAEAIADICDNIVTAIGNLPGFSASSDGVDTVTVTGPAVAASIVFDKVEKGQEQNFTLSPDDGYFTVNGPTIGAPSHTMAG